MVRCWYWTICLNQSQISFPCSALLLQRAFFIMICNAAEPLSKTKYSKRRKIEFLQLHFWCPLENSDYYNQVVTTSEFDCLSTLRMLTRCPAIFTFALVKMCIKSVKSWPSSTHCKEISTKIKGVPLFIVSLDICWLKLPSPSAFSKVARKFLLFQHPDKTGCICREALQTEV